jgi:hypothetical protein
MAQLPDQRRIVLIPALNALKYYDGADQALPSSAVIASKRGEETEVRAFLAAHPDLAAEIGDPWADIARAYENYRAMFLEYKILELSAGSISRLFASARRLVRAADGTVEPKAQRSDYTKPTLAQELERFNVPIEPELERIGLEFWLTKTREYLGIDHPAVARLLGV